MTLSFIPFRTGSTKPSSDNGASRWARWKNLPGIRTIVPGHGVVLRSWDYVRLEREAIDSLVAKANAAVADELTYEQARARLNMSRFRELFAGSDPDRQWAFDNYFHGYRRAFNEVPALWISECS